MLYLTDLSTTYVYVCMYVELRGENRERAMKNDAVSSGPFFSPSGSGSGAKIDKTVTSTASTSTVCLVKNMKI